MPYNFNLIVAFLWGNGWKVGETLGECFDWVDSFESLGFEGGKVIYLLFGLLKMSISFNSNDSKKY